MGAYERRGIPTTSTSQMKVVVPMAGRGSRFARAGVEKPKPLISIADRPMLAWAMESLKGLNSNEVIFIVLREHEIRHGVSNLVHELVGESAQVILLEGVTEGQLCTVLAARELINCEEDLLIASSDTYVVSNVLSDIQFRTSKCHGLISAAEIPGDHWSFARTDETGAVVEVAEKVRISNHASTGLYYFSSGREFVAVADEIISNGEKTKGEYYVISVFEKYIERGWRVEISSATEMWD